MNNEPLAQARQKSFFWIVTTLVLTTGLSGLIFSFLVVIVVSPFASLIGAGLSGVVLTFIIRILGYWLGLLVAIRYVFKRTAVNAGEIKKVVISFGTSIVLFNLLITGGKLLFQWQGLALILALSVILSIYLNYSLNKNYIRS